MSFSELRHFCLLHRHCTRLPMPCHFSLIPRFAPSANVRNGSVSIIPAGSERRAGIPISLLRADGPLSATCGRSANNPASPLSTHSGPIATLQSNIRHQIRDEADAIVDLEKFGDAVHFVREGTEV